MNSSPETMSELKSKILRLLKEDEEFRYAVAGLIGLEEILKRLEKHDRKFNEIITRLNEHDKKFIEIMNRLSEHDKKFNEIITEIRDIRKELREIRAYMERTSLTLEEEAREVLSSKLRKIGIDIKLSRLILPDLEINIYGIKDDLCVIGEASIRTGVGIIKSIDEKIEELKRKYPEYLRKRVLKVIYTMWTTEDAIKEAKKRKIWLIRTLEELTTPTIQSIY